MDQCFGMSPFLKKHHTKRSVLPRPPVQTSIGGCIGGRSWMHKYRQHLTSRDRCAREGGREPALPILAPGLRVSRGIASKLHLSTYIPSSSSRRNAIFASLYSLPGALTQRRLYDRSNDSSSWDSSNYSTIKEHRGNKGPSYTCV